MSVEEVTYSALLALGFNSSHIIPKERIPINEKMFKRMNSKVGDCIVYFLFSHIHPQQASELFRDCWPIHDKKMESQFRNIAYDWFKKLNQSEDFNIKPTLVVSKVVLMPTSNKFLHTVYTLCRFALRTKIRKRDPSFDILFLPHPTKPEQCQKSVQLFMKLKEDQKDRYINLVNEQRRKLQVLRSTAQKLVSRYRNSLQVKADLLSELQTKLNKSCFLEPFEKREIEDCSLNQFESEISKKIKEKSEEIRELWQRSSSYRCKEEIFWPFFENVISGKKCLSYVDGSDYKALEKDLSSNCPFVHNGMEPLSICSKGTVDLLALIKVGNIGLKSLVELAKTNLILNRDLKDQLKKSDNQTECVKVLKKDREEVQMMINTLLPTLLQSMIELKREVNSGSELSMSSYDEATFGLCPPTPQVNIDKNYRDQPLQTPFRLLELTPDVTERSVSLNLDLSRESSNLKSACRFNASKNISQNGYLSPYPNVKRRALSTVGSPSHDSGCVLSCGTDTLLQTLDKLDITPRRNKNISFSRRRSSILNRSKLLDFSSASIISKEESIRERLEDSVSSHINYENSNINNSRTTFKHKKMYFNNNNNEAHVENRLSDHQNGLLSFSQSCDKDCTDIINLSEQVNKTPKYEITNSPLVSQILKEMHSSKRLKLPGKNKSSYSSATKGQMTSVKDVKSEPGVSTSVKSSNYTPSGVTETLKRNKNVLDSDSSLFSSSSQPNSYTPKSEIQKTFLSCLSSLESWLSDNEEENEDQVDSFQFKVNSNLHKLSSVKEDLLEDFLTFEDGNKYLEKHEESLKKVLKESVFETLTESAVSGELGRNLILDESIDTEVRRESLNISRRDSILKMSRRESGGFPTLTTIVGRLSLDGENILDQSDSCLLSVSSDTLF